MSRSHLAGTTGARISEADGQVRVEAAEYLWTWNRADDRFAVHDSTGRLVVAGSGAPAVLVERDGQRVCTAATTRTYTIDDDRVAVNYEGVNGSASVCLTWRFDAAGLWVEPLRYTSDEVEAVVSVHWFAAAGRDPKPTMASAFIVHPGICLAPVLSPVVPASARLDLTTWLGRRAPEPGGPFQAWGLPAHYFCGFHAEGLPLLAGDVGRRRSATYCCGMADLPAGDMMLRIAGGCAAPVLRVRGDRWGHSCGPGELTLGPRWRVSFGADDRAAIAAYQADLLAAGAIVPKVRSTGKDETLSLAQFNTWGAQVKTDAMMDRFDQTRLESIYREYTASGIAHGVFVIDDKWEGKYGVLEHDAERFPNFPEFLDRVRADGHKIGLWAAFLRCEDPAALGLAPGHMMCGADGKPITRGRGYHLYDVTQPEVRDALRQCVHRFMRRYRPSLVKFDFGYELPSTFDSCPSDPNYAGERLLGHALDLVVGAMREVDPDVAVMYYSLSPLLSATVDQCSTDDLFLATGEFAAEANRRLYYSSVLGELGVPSYGSSGYDTHLIEEIWFDSVACGTLGSLGSFASGSPHDRLTPRQVAIYNGLARLSRRASVFTVEALDAVPAAIASGGRASSWARYEHGAAVLVVLRPHGFAGAPGAARFRDDVEVDTTVALASCTDENLDRSTHLAMVTAGPAQITLRHNGPHQTLTITAHGLGGVTKTLAEHPVRRGQVTFAVPDRFPDDSLIEHVELHFA